MEEMEVEFERNINKIAMDTPFQSPVQKKDISTINDYVYNNSNNQVDKISDSKEQVDTSSRSRTNSVEQVDPSSDLRVDTHITNGIQTLFIRLKNWVGDMSTAMSLTILLNWSCYRGLD